MKVILTKDVEHLGLKGDVVDVADGFARNYLVPKNLAIKATSGSLRQADALRAAREEAERRARSDAEQLAQALSGTRVVVAARAGDEGRLYGSIGPGDVAEAIRKFTGVDVERKAVLVAEPIREIGLHEVVIRPHPDVQVHVTLDVIPV